MTPWTSLLLGFAVLVCLTAQPVEDVVTASKFCAPFSVKNGMDYCAVCVPLVRRTNGDMERFHIFLCLKYNFRV